MDNKNIDQSTFKDINLFQEESFLKYQKHLKAFNYKEYESINRTVKNVEESISYLSKHNLILSDFENVTTYLNNITKMLAIEIEKEEQNQNKTGRFKILQPIGVEIEKLDLDLKKIVGIYLKPYEYLERLNKINQQITDLEKIFSNNGEYLSRLDTIKETTETLATKAANAAKEIDGIVKLSSSDATQLIRTAQSLNTKNALNGFDTIYLDLNKITTRAKNIWLCITIISAVLTIAAVFFIFYQNHEWITDNNGSKFSNYYIISESTITILLISITIWFAKKYSTTHILEIEYLHRSVSSQALLPFIASVRDEHIKDTILLEAARMIFSIPNVGQQRKNELDLKLLDVIKDINPTAKI